MIAVDTETYPNYILVAAKSEDGTKWYEEIYGEEKRFGAEARYNLRRLLRDHPICTFNGMRFDQAIFAGILAGYTAREIFEISQDIIIKNMHAFMVIRDRQIDAPEMPQHYDLFAISPALNISLKMSGARLHTRNIQDLPIEPGKTVTTKQARALRRYCWIDLEVSLLLYKDISDRCDLRDTLCDRWDLDLKPKSDAQIAESVAKHEMNIPRQEDEHDDMKFHIHLPGDLGFRHPELNSLLDDVSGTQFKTRNGRAQLPAKLNRHVLKNRFKFGIGGLHSTESGLVVMTDKKYRKIGKVYGGQLWNIDVTSYYPQIILNMKLAPSHLGMQFLKFYRQLVDMRLDAKKRGDKTASDGLKIVINGMFGKFGSKWSVVYAPDLMLSVTISGQLMLLRLIEMLERRKGKHKVISANTDGLVVYTRDSADLADIQDKWEDIFGFETEAKMYGGYWGRDVNNYFAKEAGGDITDKGIFSPPSITKNPNAWATSYAVREAILGGGRRTLDDVIHELYWDKQNVCPFLFVRNVRGGSKWGKKYLGRVARWYWLHGEKGGRNIEYVSNGYKVCDSDNSRPLMRLPEDERIPQDLGIDRYINRAYKTLEGLGMKFGPGPRNARR
ncbi:MAG: hypothetical protein OXU36_10645 [Candidatus Poribacteria bacterium]|nr:hypothetical protein [Candidatus Poribacteria bacterium]